MVVILSTLDGFKKLVVILLTLGKFKKLLVILLTLGKLKIVVNLLNCFKEQGKLKKTFLGFCFKNFPTV